ncbi:hypothetical protein ABTX34_32940 [Streptomyces sp. NPDC096538]|uniref:hypothetical protein n=1 Tax=Streptomyces sp. NPDC096538 TaxID=3155427 RepID=UPI003321D85E
MTGRRDRPAPARPAPARPAPARPGDADPAPRTGQGSGATVANPARRRTHADYTGGVYGSMLAASLGLRILELRQVPE